MNTPTVLLAAICLAAGTSLALTLALAPTPPADSQPDSLAPDELEGLRAEIAALRHDNAELRDELEDVRAMRAAAGNRTAVGDLEALVRRVLAEREGEGSEVGGALGDSDLAERSAEELVELLLDGSFDSVARQNLWKELHEAGRTEELIAAFEARAAADPNDPEKQLELGQAYLHEIQEVGNGPLAGVLATNADKAFDRALEIDPEHWNARFHKAVSLSFWPPVFGKQNEAIAQFETLITQQAGLAPAPEHAQTHLLLGNMYQQIGQTDKAIAAWQQGLSIFPGDEGLSAQLQLVLGGK